MGDLGLQDIIHSTHTHKKQKTKRSWIRFYPRSSVKICWVSLRLPWLPVLGALVALSWVRLPCPAQPHRCPNHPAGDETPYIGQPNLVEFSPLAFKSAWDTNGLMKYELKTCGSVRNVHLFHCMLGISYEPPLQPSSMGCSCQMRRP